MFLWALCFVKVEKFCTSYFVFAFLLHYRTFNAMQSPNMNILSIYIYIYILSYYLLSTFCLEQCRFCLDLKQCNKSTPFLTWNAPQCGFNFKFIDIALLSPLHVHNHLLQLVVVWSRDSETFFVRSVFF